MLLVYLFCLNSEQDFKRNSFFLVMRSIMVIKAIFVSTRSDTEYVYVTI